MAKSKFIELLDSFISVYIPISRGLSNNTVNSYKTTFTLFIIFLYEKKGMPADKITFEKLDADTVSSFLQWLESERKCSVSTRNQRKAALLSFARYAQNRDFSAAVTFREALYTLPLKKGNTKEQTVMSREEVKILMNLPNPETPLGYRDRVLFSVMYASGARAQEMCDLTVEDVLHNDAGDVILNLLGKGRKRRRVKLSSAPSRMLDAYIKKRGIETRSACCVFSSQCHPNMSVSGIEEVFKKYIALARKENPTLFRCHEAYNSMSYAGIWGFTECYKKHFGS